MEKPRRLLSLLFMAWTSGKRLCSTMHFLPDVLPATGSEATDPSDDRLKVPKPGFKTNLSFFNKVVVCVGHSKGKATANTQWVVRRNS